MVYKKLNQLFWTGILLLFVLPSYAQRGKEQMSVVDYITLYSGMAQSEMRRTGIPASITLAQGILESNFGNSKLAIRANNHFGIKCGGNWNGPTFIQDDDEKGECFRKYRSVEHSFVDHSNFLIGKDRYAALFKLDPTDYRGWAHGLQKAGYATNPNYATLLIRLIDERNLHKFDTEQKYEALSKEEEEYLKTFDNKFFLFNGIKTVISQPNEVALDIAYKNDMSLRQVLKYNDLKENDVIQPGSKIYLQPKRRKGFEKYHIVKQGETMHSISQKQGIKLKSLYKKNLMTAGQEPAVGETLCLRSKCDKAPRLKTDEDIKKEIKQQINEKIEAAVKTTEAEPTKPKPQPQKTVDTLAIKTEEIPPVPEEKTIPTEQEEVLNEVEEMTNEDSVVSEEAEAEESEPVTEQPKKPSINLPIFHQVAPKETLYGISRMYNVTVDQLKGWNGLVSNNLEIGQSLIVGYTGSEPIEKTLSPVKQEPSQSWKEKPVATHTVQPKETLYSISRQYGISVDELRRLNNLSSNELSIGQVLRVK